MSIEQIQAVGEYIVQPIVWFVFVGFIAWLFFRD